MQKISLTPTLYDTVQKWKQQGESVAFVPTMGALHEGHLTMIKLAKQKAKKVVVSIFVNPQQFGPNEDFAAYPRQEQQDLVKLESIGVDLVYLPTVADMYPEPFTTGITLGKVADELCGVARPGHFKGMALAVVKLLMRVQPDTVFFGEKDYQQLYIVRQVVKDLDIPVTIISVPTVRAQDGLALSSRNTYLTDSQRAIAPRFYRVLHAIAMQFMEGDSKIESLVKWGTKSLLMEGFNKIEYIEARDAMTLEPLTSEMFERPFRIMGAVHLGKCRLIDNVGNKEIATDA